MPGPMRMFRRDAADREVDPIAAEQMAVPGVQFDLGRQLRSRRAEFGDFGFPRHELEAPDHGRDEGMNLAGGVGEADRIGADRPALAGDGPIPHIEGARRGRQIPHAPRFHPVLDQTQPIAPHRSPVIVRP